MPNQTNKSRTKSPALMAGLELDCLIAKKVFGRTLFTATPEQPAIYSGCKVIHSTWIELDKPWHEWGPYVEQIPNYSTSNGDAFDVLERMVKWSHEHNWSPAIHVLKESDPLDDFIYPKHQAARYQVSFMFGCSVTAPTMPEAICLAAIKVLDG